MLLRISIFTAVAGAVLLGVGLVGYLFRPVGPIKSVLFRCCCVRIAYSGDGQGNLC